MSTARRSCCGCCNCCGGFGCPECCHHCCGGCCGCGHCDTMTFPVSFGACVNNPCCECCKKPPKKGFAQWPCMWPCCCECKVPEFKLKPLKPKAVPKDCHDCCHCCHGCCHGCCHDCCHCCHCCPCCCCCKRAGHGKKRCTLSPAIERVQPYPYVYGLVAPFYYGSPLVASYPYYYV